MSGNGFNLCPTCKQEFRSKSPKEFCSIKCYTASDRFRQMQEENRLKIAKNYEEKFGRPYGPAIKNCLNCNAVFKSKHSHNRKFCRPSCRRAYYTARFDRFVANPETLALPQCYDEFLTKEELPCLFAGCDWVGKNLATHVNYVHGVTAREFKKLAGFNLKTGLVTPDVSDVRSQIAKDMGLGNFGIGDNVRNVEVAPDRYISLEAKEHLAKARADGAIIEKMRQGSIRYMRTPEARQNLASHIANTRARCEANPIKRTCKYVKCGKEFDANPMTPIAYCSPSCKQAAIRERMALLVHPLTCRQCQREFLGTYGQLQNHKKGFAVYCGEECLSNRRSVSAKQLNASRRRQA